MASDKPRFLLLYGSQTGNAEAITEEIADQAASHGLIADRFILDDTDKKVIHGFLKNIEIFPFIHDAVDYSYNDPLMFRKNVH